MISETKTLAALLAAAVILQSALPLSVGDSGISQVLSGSAQPSSQAPISLEGYERVAVSVTPSVIYLRSGCMQMALVTTSFQTYSIQNGLDSKIDFRPTSHDVMADMIENLGVEVKLAKIDSMEDSIYYSRLYVKQGSRLLALDSKPSDAIAVAVRFSSPVYISSALMAEGGKSIC